MLILYIFCDIIWLTIIIIIHHYCSSLLLFIIIIIHHGGNSLWEYMVGKSIIIKQLLFMALTLAFVIATIIPKRYFTIVCLPIGYPATVCGEINEMILPATLFAWTSSLDYDLIRKNFIIWM